MRKFEGVNGRLYRFCIVWRVDLAAGTAVLYRFGIAFLKGK